MNSQPDFWELPNRPGAIFLFLASGLLVLVGLHYGLERYIEGDFWPKFLIDRNGPSQGDQGNYYPFTIHAVLHLTFFIGLGELFVRWRVAERETAFLREEFLPEDEETVLQSHDLGPIRMTVTQRFDSEHGFLPSLIDISILQYFSSRSVDQTVSVLNSSMELIEHRLDLRYNPIRYLAWLIPTIGFIGTVLGIALALEDIDPLVFDLEKITQSLGMAFYTTIIALCWSAILAFMIHYVQAREERSLNDAGHYTLRNLINRLYTGE